MENGIANARCEDKNDTTGSENKVGKRNLPLCKGDDHRISRTVCHDLPPTRDDDVSQEDHGAKDMQAF